MDLITLIRSKRAHVDRLSSQHGIAGETAAIVQDGTWLPRPKGPALRTLIAALAADGTPIKPSSFDAIAVPADLKIDLSDPAAVKAGLPRLTFVEIKTANQPRVRDDFSNYFFALTENEIEAAAILGTRHCVALFNKISGRMLITSVPQLLTRARSTTWQVSIQL